MVWEQDLTRGGAVRCVQCWERRPVSVGAGRDRGPWKPCGVAVLSRQRREDVDRLPGVAGGLHI